MQVSLRFDDSDSAEVISVLARMPNQFVAAVLARTVPELKQRAPQATSNLTNSARHRMTGDGAGEIVFGANYASFAHDGRGSGGVDFGAIEDWAASKGINRSAAFAIAKSIAAKGTTANPWVNDFVESQRMTEIMQRAAAQVARHVA